VRFVGHRAANQRVRQSRHERRAGANLIADEPASTSSASGGSAGQGMVRDNPHLAAALAIRDRDVRAGRGPPAALPVAERQRIVGMKRLTPPLDVVA